MESVLVSTIIFLAALTQSLSGFGFGLVAAPLLSASLDVHVAAPLVSLIAVSNNGALWLYYRRAFDFRAVTRLSVAALGGIPIGILVLHLAPKQAVLTTLGLVVIGYALYALSQLRLPELKSPRWAYLFGLLSGILSGAYNVGGPPVVIYANCSHWSPEAFKSNLPGFFLISTVVVALGRALDGSFTIEIWQLFAQSMPALGLGILTGTLLSRYITRPELFQRIVLGLLIVVGLRLLF